MTGGLSGHDVTAPSDDASSRMEEDVKDRQEEPPAAGDLQAPAGQQDFAWRVHATLLDWIGRVDNKAWIALTLQSAALGIVVNLSVEDRPLASLSGSQLWLFRIGAVAVGIAAVLAAAVVYPHLGGRRRARSNDLIYFGHVRSLTEREVESGLLALTAEHEVAMLARQLKAMSTIAWRKHQLLRASLILWLVGVLLLVGSAV